LIVEGMPGNVSAGMVAGVSAGMVAGVSAGAIAGVSAGADGDGVWLLRFLHEQTTRHTMTNR